VFRRQKPVVGDLAVPPLSVPSEQIPHDIGGRFCRSETEVLAEKKERRPAIHEVRECEYHLLLDGVIYLTPQSRDVGVKELEPGGVFGAQGDEVVQLSSIQPPQPLDGR